MGKVGAILKAVPYTPIISSFAILQFDMEASEHLPTNMVVTLSTYFLHLTAACREGLSSFWTINTFRLIWYEAILLMRGTSAIKIVCMPTEHNIDCTSAESHWLLCMAINCCICRNNFATNGFNAFNVFKAAGVGVAQLCFRQYPYKLISPTSSKIDLFFCCMNPNQTRNTPPSQDDWFWFSTFMQPNRSCSNLYVHVYLCSSSCYWLQSATCTRSAQYFFLLQFFLLL